MTSFFRAGVKMEAVGSPKTLIIFYQATSWYILEKIIQVDRNWAYILVKVNSWRIFFFCGASTRLRIMASTYGISRSHSLDTLNRPPLDEWSAWRRNFYLIKHNADIHTPAWIEPKTPGRAQGQTLDRAASGIGGFRSTRRRTRSGNERVKPTIQVNCDY
jgi:hypothetical protein